MGGVGLRCSHEGTQQLVFWQRKQENECTTLTWMSHRRSCAWVWTKYQSVHNTSHSNLGQWWLWQEVNFRHRFDFAQMTFSWTLTSFALVAKGTQNYLQRIAGPLSGKFLQNEKKSSWLYEPHSYLCAKWKGQDLNPECRDFNQVCKSPSLKWGLTCRCHQSGLKRLKMSI